MNWLELAAALERWWHDRRMAWALPVMSTLVALGYWSNWGDEITLKDVVLASGVAAVISAFWHLAHRTPKVGKSRVGIVVAIVGDDGKHDEQISADFIRSLRSMLEADQG